MAPAVSRFDALPNLVSQVVAQCCTARDLTTLIHLCMDMSAAIIRTRFQRKLAMLERAGYTLEDCAVLSIEELFLPKAGIQAAECARFFKAEMENDVCASAGECVIALRRLIYRKVHQTMISITGEADPEYRKVLRNIHEAVVRPENGFATRAYFNDTLLHRAGAADRLELHKPDIPYETLCSLLCAQAGPDASTAELIDLLLTEAEAASDYRSAVSQADLAAAIRDFYSLRVHRDAVPTTHIPSDLADFEVRDAIARVIARMRDKLLRKSKSDEAHAQAETAVLESAVREFLEDLVEHTPHPLFEYYQAHYPGATYEQYRANGRIRFEYIMHTAKTDFFDECGYLVQK